ncbi:MAG: methyltransferase domain-containing protein [Bacteroidales bacterium]|nr:methyltransferase domain-containing protein [Bacteroidales bacterium]
MIQTQIETLTKKKITEIDFPEIDKLISTLSSDLNNGKITKKEILTMNQSFGQEFLENTIQGHGLRKPFGYSGDFLMIDKIYTFHTSPIEKFKIWDEYFHLQSAPKAVRNRKDYFKKIIKEKLNKYKKMNLMNVASGPARDLFELYEENKNCELNTVCIEMDENAIKYAENLNLKYLNKISFVHKNIFRHKEESKFDVIWSAGLFDYFDEKSFVLMLKKFKEWLNDNGEIIIGNFNEDHNPSRDYMEILGDWHLHHRTEIELKELAEKAGFNPNQIIIGKEKENVNLFLHIKN